METTEPHDTCDCRRPGTGDLIGRYATRAAAEQDMMHLTGQPTAPDHAHPCPTSRWWHLGRTTAKEAP